MTKRDYQLLKEKLRSRPHQLDSLEDWLLLVINTARAMIDNVNKSRLTDLKEFLDCETTAQMQLTYDHFQGNSDKLIFLIVDTLTIFISTHLLPIFQTIPYKQNIKFISKSVWTLTATFYMN